MIDPSSGTNTSFQDLLASPCIGVCSLDEASGWCLGCGRSGAEIGAWRDLGVDRRQAVWTALPNRLARLGRDLRPWPWTGPTLLRRLHGLVEGTGRASLWTLGCTGPVRALSLTAETAVHCTLKDDSLTLTTPDLALRVRCPRGARLFERPATDEAPQEFVLALHRAYVKSPSATVLTSLGPDTGALKADHRSHLLFDLGLGRLGLRPCLRTGDGALIRFLDTACGAPPMAVLPALQSHLQAAKASINLDMIGIGPAGRLERPWSSAENATFVAAENDTLVSPLLAGDAANRHAEARLGLPPDYLICLKVQVGLSKPDH